jgi:hypothetical protein
MKKSIVNQVKIISLLIIVLFFGKGYGAKQEVGEYLIVSGGPALRKWEDLRLKKEQHDRWWGNFIRPARVRMVELQKQLPAGTVVTWLVYSGAYIKRASEDKQPLMSHILSVRDTYKINLVFFSDAIELIRYINESSHRKNMKISGFEFFGHSNKHCMMFDYSSEVSGASAVWLHENDLKKIDRGAFISKPYCQSWGCHAAESMCKVWKKRFGFKLVGALGKTDYTNMHLHNWQVGLSDGSRWVR